MPACRVRCSMLALLSAAVVTLWNISLGECLSLQTRLPQPFQSFYAAGTPTLEIGAEFLPRCVFQHSDDGETVIELVNNSTATVLAATSNASDSELLWGFAAHPVLNSSHTGVYVCRSSRGQYSPATFKLSVVSSVRIAFPEHVVVENRTMTTVYCAATGYPLSATRLLPVSIHSALVTSKQTSVLGDWQEYTVTMVFPGGLPKATSPTEITCTARLLDFPCTPGSRPSVRRRCQSTRRVMEKRTTLRSVRLPEESKPHAVV